MPRLPASLSNVAPLNLILIAGTLYLCLIFAVVNYLTIGPWLGFSIQLDTGQNGAVIESLETNAVGDLLKVGDRIVAISSNGERWYELNELVNVSDPDSLSTYKSHNEFFELQERIWNELHGERVFLKLDDDQTVVVPVKQERPVSNLPTSFWLLTLLGFAAASLGAGVWAFRQDQIAAGLLALSGLCLFIGTLSNLHLFRELALDPAHFKIIANINYIAMAGTGWFWVLVLLHYPKQLMAFPTIGPVCIWMMLVWVNATFQLIEVPVHAFYYHYFLGVSLMVAIAWAQWIATRNLPLERAALLWLVLSMLVASALVVVLYILPVVLSGVDPIINESSVFVLLFGFYVGVTLGILRFRLFNLEKWWFETWLFIAGFFLLVALDLILVYLLQFARPTAFGLAFVIVLGWIYMPARSMLRKMTQQNSKRDLEHHVPMLINTLFSSTASIDQDKKWETILNNVFRPSEIKLMDRQSTEIRLDSEGSVLMVPAIGTDKTYSLFFRDHGSRIFSSEDIELAKNLMSLTRTSYSVKEAQEVGAREERDRIMRDFHDDVASNLLTLVQRAKDEETVSLSKKALKALREAIYSLDNVDHRNLLEVLYEVRFDCAQRLLDKDIELQWEMNEVDDQLLMSARQNVNFRRIMQELVSNILKHSSATSARVKLDVHSDRMTVSCENNGIGDDIADGPSTGKGLSNIEVRATELGGEVHWELDQIESNFVVRFNFPLSNH